MKLTRRHFLKAVGASSLLITLSEPINNAFALYSQRVFIHIELIGGNDGLNTVIPFKDPVYYALRPTLAIKSSDVLPINDSFAFHPQMTGFLELWNRGRMAIVLGVGYPQPDLSHFRSTDIWRGANTAPFIDSGWIARYLRAISTKENQNLTYPQAIEVQNLNTLITSDGNIFLGIATTNPSSLYNNMRENINLPKNNSLTGFANKEYEFIYQTRENSKNLSKIIYEINNSQKNSITYPSTSLSNQLSMVARLINGKLPTGIYTLSLGGFDTHSNQLSTHQSLLKTLSDALSTFIKDMDNLGLSDKVIILITSEFGRRVKENGSGTDHGTSQPVFVVGNVNPGLYGVMPSLTDLDSNGNMKFTLDFRRIYATILTRWFEVSQNMSNKILFGEYYPMEFISRNFIMG